VNYCIEVDPEDRPDSMAVVIERLELVLAELSEQAKAPTPAK
jgi:hypothetical protein